MDDRQFVLRDIWVIGNEVVCLWDDGHESYFSGEQLRRACTCAACKSEGHLFGKSTLPTLRALPPEAFVPVAVRRVGNYGVQVVWADGHDFGIYHLRELRQACPCQRCRGEGGTDASMA